MTCPRVARLHDVMGQALVTRLNDTHLVSL
jgi:hypothetical protein